MALLATAHGGTSFSPADFMPRFGVDAASSTRPPARAPEDEPAPDLSKRLRAALEKIGGKPSR